MTGEAAWEAWMDECERAYEKCKCGTKSSGGKLPYSTKSLGTGIVPRAPETKTLSGSSAGRGTYETKSSAVISEHDLADALCQLRGLRAQCQCNQQETFVEKQLKAAQRVTQAHEERWNRELAQARQEANRINW